MKHLLLSVFLTIVTPLSLTYADGNHFAYFDANDPYYVSRHFPKLTTPQWIGEEGVEAVVVLAIDDMRGHEKWEAYLRPILNRLKKIDGRAPVSIMTCRIDPKEPHLQTWLKEGVSIEVHTYDHPCPILQGGSLSKAKGTYDHCVDLLAQIPNSHPVAFRTPCCDSMNTPSPRMFSEIFKKTSPKGNFLRLDSSVFCTLTPNDPELPRETVLVNNRQSRFDKYLPKDRSFVNLIEDYPYPYVLGGLCWEFPCITPSDWQAQHLHKPNNALTVRDWKAALDAVVTKQATFNLVFHPHGWIRNTQVIELIDYAVTKYGKKVKFLTFREAAERLQKHLLAGQTLRNDKGNDNGVRIIDVNRDGYLDVLIGNEIVRKMRIWDNKKQQWNDHSFPIALHNVHANFGTVDKEKSRPFLITRTEDKQRAWSFTDNAWIEKPQLVPPKNAVAMLRDVDGDGVCELIQNEGVYQWQSKAEKWQQVSTLPKDVTIDPALRFIDINDDGNLDVIYSNEKHYSLHLFSEFPKGWSTEVMKGKHGDANALPMIARRGRNNGVWFHSGHLWVQNEDTALLKDKMDRRSFRDLLKHVMPEAKSPQASLKCLQTAPGFKVELVASEPLVQDPISFDWGPDGKLWVVEMGDYPLGVDGKNKPGGRVRFLNDTNNDGKYDQSTIFLDNLGYPSAVMAWRKGVLVSCAPEIFYAEDTNDDGKADRKVVLYSGFGEGNQQHRVNGFSRGLDNWIHCANGDSGGVIKSHKTGKTVNISGRDFRIHPDSGAIEAVTGQTQYGRNRDDWGNWFGGNNSNPMWHFVLADRYLRRNPLVIAPNLRIPVSTQPGPAPVYPRSRTLERFNDFDRANRFTSACSPIVYRDTLFGSAFVNNTFVCEPVHNLVHREVMQPKGITFQSSRAANEQRSEFLASTDNWFRPTTVRTGPDGTLWVADMYRLVIEHPQWIPKSWQERLDLRAGHDKGRIYRIVPVNAKLRRIPRLHKLHTTELVHALDHSNGWQRDLAQELLIQKADPQAIPLLQKLLSDSKRPLARLHALCTLAGMDSLSMTDLQHALLDTHPGVQIHAIRLSEGRKLSKECKQSLEKLAKVSESKLCLQLLCSLGSWKEPWAAELLAQLAPEVQGNRYLSTAFTSSINKANLPAILTATLARKRPSEKLIQLLLAMAEALGEKSSVAVLLREVSTKHEGKYADWQMRVFAGFLHSLQQRGTSLSKLGTQASPELKKELANTEALFEYARQSASDSKLAIPQRLLAIRLLGQGMHKQNEDIKQLSQLLSPLQSREIQLAAINTLGQLSTKDVPAHLLKGWNSYTPPIRAAVISTLLQRTQGVQSLLSTIENKQIDPRAIETTSRERLLKHRDVDIRQRAAKVMAEVVPEERKKVLTAFAKALTLKGNLMKGRELFRKNCMACHRLENVGQQVGPDLTALTDKSSESLFTAILDPNRAVEAKYLNYIVEMKNGQTHTGALTNETGTSLTLVNAEGKSLTLLRKNIDALLSTRKSLMPEGLEKELSVESLADLIAYLQTVQK